MRMASREPRRTYEQAVKYYSMSDATGTRQPPPPPTLAAHSNATVKKTIVPLRRAAAKVKVDDVLYCDAECLGVTWQARERPPCRDSIEIGERKSARTVMNASSRENDMCLLGVPKKGRLFERVNQMLDGIGLQYARQPRQDIAYCRAFPLKIVFLPAKDIARFVGEGKVDIGITGQDMVAESNVVVQEVMATGFGRCELAVQAPVADSIRDPKLLLGKRIATSFPHLTEKFFRELGGGENMPNIRVISGSVEAACGLGLADAVVDLVETGTTMRAAGLEIVGTVMKTEAVVISNPHTPHSKMVETLQQRIAGYLLAKQNKMIYYNVLAEKLEEASKITPGAKKPTVTPLQDPKWLSVGAMVPAKEVNNIMDALHLLGATDIFVVDLLNCRA